MITQNNHRTPMTTIYKQRMTTHNDEDIVVFLIGMRINTLWKIHKWLPVALAMPRMLKELYTNPESGFISQESWFGKTTIMVQYWQSFSHLERYAKDRNAEHLPAWAAFNKKIASNGDVGIWHETYCINKNNYESIYNNMPIFGLAKARGHIPVHSKQDSAKQRLETAHE